LDSTFHPGIKENVFCWRLVTHIIVSVACPKTKANIPMTAAPAKAKKKNTFITNDIGDDVHIAVGVSNTEKAKPHHRTYQMMEMNVCHYHMLSTRRKYQLTFH
jgi:4-hydroxyphenylpyruvate dioxygenase-like putative hemolysin